MNKKPVCFPVVAQDAVNYLIGKYLADSQIRCVLRLNGRIDETMLQQAVWLSLDVEPILRCRFIEDGNYPVWELRKDLDIADLFSVVETNNIDEELQKFIDARYDTDCQIKVRLIRTESDTVCIKINHACSDAAGLKQYLNLLASIYNQLCKGLQYVVEPRTSSRGQDQIFNIQHIANAVNEIMKTGTDPAQPTVAFPCKLREENERTFVANKIYSVNNIADYARNNDATVNDVLLTAFIRVVSKIAKIQNKTIAFNFTVDLRRYLPDRTSKTICNLSVIQDITVNHDPTESFDETLSRLVMETKKIMRNYPGIKSAYSLELAHEKMSIFKNVGMRFQQRQKYFSSTGLCIPTLSNVGIIADETTKFGLLKIDECYMVGPAVFSPGFAIIASTYDNTLTLTVNSFQSTMPKAMIEQFMNSMCNELSSLFK
ncbi:condensation domain-containing protein [Propionispora vibrioides]|uniref:Uncharacterized protein, contains a NRPS condensation (Elongation) domain n=1 Tax=Propionispora vibrioides TaxID=112903 RepID=A0A1H8XMP4_9FIRM|nr:condensation domain-containing protein [Propionispora vibrioides]SEP41067.1 Uncharacterized protein, contains a NRPS condensation (elongation) domain [Propionispora vibrioides]